MSFCVTSRRLGGETAYLNLTSVVSTRLHFAALERALIDARILGLNISEHHLGPMSRMGPLDDLRRNGSELGIVASAPPVTGGSATQSLSAEA
jgi:hypothetical protein